MRYSLHSLRCFLPLALALGLAAASAPTASAGCSPLPPINPRLGFVANFNNPCYAVLMVSGNGVNSVGDLNSTYNQTYFQAQPGYDLVILGTFPNTRFMSVSVNDEHLLEVAQLIDTQILPLNAAQINPLLPGVTYKANQQYGISVNLGFGHPGSAAAGCSTSNSTIEQNVLDASQIHSGITWTGYPNLPRGFPPHQTGPNSAGAIQVRKYVDIATPATAVVIVRRLSDGCALSAQDAIAMNILGPRLPTPNTWVNEQQINAHGDFAINIQPRLCYPQDPRNAAIWVRPKEYIPLPNAASANVQATLNPDDLQSVFSGAKYMRIRFQLPTTPTTPCAGGGCTFTGNEQLRYKSLSFQFGNTTLLSIKDSDFVKDPNGYVALIVGVGPAPSQVTAANYYTYVDFSQYTGYQNFKTLFVRDVIPGPGFDCSAFNVPFKTMAYNPEGGFMGTYNMSLDYTVPEMIPIIPTPPNRSNSCALVPPPPQVCSTNTP